MRSFLIENKPETKETILTVTEYQSVSYENYFTFQWLFYGVSYFSMVFK